jgi:hypothetical protein
MRTKAGRKLQLRQCSVCGCAVPRLAVRAFDDVRGDGWYSGHLTIATENGYEVPDVRCPQHIPPECRASAGCWPTSSWPVIVA